jgi:hydroxymethylglutaryl-CoA synthase
MAGIASYGAYIPLHRLGRSELHRAWGGMGMLGMSVPGEKAVASYDEDSVTMGVEAAIDCMRDIDPKAVDGLFFASTTHPYSEKQSSAIASAALDMGRQIKAADFAGSLRAGTIAMSSALDAVQAGSAGALLVIAADTRLGAPSGLMEQSYGDGSAAFLMGNDDGIATVEASHSICDEFSGVWRASTDTFVRSWEDRMVLDTGYSPIMSEAMSGVMDKCGLKPGDFAKAVYYAPLDVRAHSKLARSLGFDPAQVQDPMFLTVGNTGTALAMMMLVSALEEAKPGDRILFASYGNGADALVLKVTDAMEKMGSRRGMKAHMESKRLLTNYERYLRWRGIIPMEAAARPELTPTSISALRRDRREILGLYGVKCRKCGSPQYRPPASAGGRTPSRICVICQAKDDFDDYRFADRKARIFNFTHDHIATTPDPPATNVIIDFDGGGRGMFDMTDRDPDGVEVGMPVEMTFRKLFFDRGIHNYYWKARPIRVKEDANGGEHQG